MDSLSTLIQSLKAGRHLSREEAELSAHLLGSEAISEVDKIGFKALADKGETAEEVMDLPFIFAV